MVRSPALILLASLLACGTGSSAQSGESTGAASSSGGDVPTTGAPQPGSATTEEPTGPAGTTSTGSTTMVSTSTEPTTTQPATTELSTATEQTTEQTTGAPVGCPEGQEPLAEIWARTFAPADPLTIHSVDGPILTRADGRLVAGLTFWNDADEFGTGYLIVGADGEGEEFKATGFMAVKSAIRDMAIGSDDGAVFYVVRIGPDWNDAAIVRMSADGAPVGEFPLPTGLTSRGVIALIFEDVVVAGTGASLWPRIGRYTPGGAEVWTSQVFNAPEYGLLNDLARRPDGDLVYVGVGNVKQNSDDYLRLVLGKVQPSGQVKWAESLGRQPFDAATAIATTATGQVVALVNTWNEVAPSVVVVGLDGNDGLWKWETQIAGMDPMLGNGWARTILVDDDGLTIPVSHHHGLKWDEPSDELKVVVHRLGLDGQAIAATPLPLAPTLATPADGWATRGACGELVMMLKDAGKVRVAVHAHE